MDTALQRKWNRYEKRWQFRHFYFDKCLRAHFFLKYIHREPVMPHFAKKWIMNIKKTNDYLYEKIVSENSFMACRFGNTELQTMVGEMAVRLNGHSEKRDAYIKKWYTRLGEGAGFFPVTEENLSKFTDLMLLSCKEVDLLAMWHLHMEDFMIEEYVPQAKLTYLFRLEPWLYKGRPWTSALKGKKVLVIHPFEKTIRSQYEKRREIWPNREILPDFNLLTLKAVQTICGERDDRFDNWFDALEYMYEEAMKMDFDIAIIGCGAYGFPLAAKLKHSGKQAIHLGGATQLLFGIKGYRWENNYPSKIATCFNEAWVYPSEEETPQNAKVVEQGCYWK